MVQLMNDKVAGKAFNLLIKIYEIRLFSALLSKKSCRPSSNLLIC